MALYLYYGLVFVAIEYNVGFAGKSILGFSIFLPVFLIEWDLEAKINIILKKCRNNIVMS